MLGPRTSVGVFVVALSLTLSTPAWASPARDTIDLTVAAGRPLRIAIAGTTRVGEVGQAVTGKVVEPVYVYDRIVIPVGTLVRGHVASLVPPSRWAHVRSIAEGDFSPHRTVVLKFDTLTLPDNQEVAIDAVVTQTIDRVTSEVAGGSKPAAIDGDGIRHEADAAVATAKERLHDAVSMVKQPGKIERLKAGLIDQLPYHPQYLSGGAMYVAELSAPIALGTADPVERAVSGTLPAPQSILSARLATALDSATTARGTAIIAVVTTPVFSTDHRLIVPEGTRLSGEVTLARGARRFHRNGQIRFLFERVELPEAPPSDLLASLYAVEVSGTDRLAVDDEGGAKITNSKTRFIEPVLSVMALRASTDNDRFDGDRDSGEFGGGTTPPRAGGRGGLGGFFGFGLAGAVLGRASRPLGIAFSVVGAARSVYRNVLARGKEVSFPVDTAIQLQLAPAPVAPVP